MLVLVPAQVAVALVQTAFGTIMQYQCLHTASAMATIAVALPIAPACPAQYLALLAILAPCAHYSH